MKGKITFISFIFLCTILFTIQIAAQTVDTLVVEAEPVGNINNVINGDTTSTGERVNPNRVYLLKNDGESHSTFYITEPIIIKDLTLIGESNPNTKFPPVIVPNINENNSSVSTFIKIKKGGTVNLENLYLLGTRDDNISITQDVISALGDSVTFKLNKCVFENFGATESPNIINTWDAIGSDIFITNCIFRNNQSNLPQSPGLNWAGPGVNAIDTMLIKNSTFFIFGGIIEGASSSMGYIEFDHNTIFLQTQSSLFRIPQMHHAKITNNIFYSIYSSGLDSLHIYGSGVWSNSYYKPAIIELDSLQIDLEGSPYYLTEADRIIKATNNVYFWPKKILDNFDKLNGDPRYQVVGGRIITPVWITTKPGAESILTDRESWPGIDIYTNNDSIDPGFDADLVQAATDSMARFVRYVWENGGDGSGSKPFVFLSDPNHMFKGVTENWTEIQNYPVAENLRYANQALMLAGTDGLPLGDLNWFPEHIVDIEEPRDLLTENFKLYQNYPNPFNPTTKIKYAIPNGGFVTIKIFNLLGQVVTTLVNKEHKAGEYTVELNINSINSCLPSGVYFYRLQYASYSKTKKLILLK